jgi:hypothetical protein
MRHPPNKYIVLVVWNDTLWRARVYCEVSNSALRTQARRHAHARTHHSEEADTCEEIRVDQLCKPRCSKRCPV